MATSIESIILQTPLQDMGKIVAAELEEYTSARPELIVEGYEQVDSYKAHFMNNFHLKVFRVGGKNRMDFFLQPEYKDKTFLMLVDDGIVNPNAGHSDFYLSRTPTQFKEDLDKCVSACHFDVKSIERQVAKCIPTKSPLPLKQIAEQLLPVYTMMRAIGYNHIDVI